MSCNNEIKKTVSKYYGKIWKAQGTCCNASCELAEVVPLSDRSPHEVLLDEIKPLKGKTILDVGCGNGNTVLAITKEVGPNGKVVGIDISPEGIAEAKRKAVELGLEKVTEFRVADAEQLPFKDNSFDIVISECVVCLTPDKQKALNEKARVLKPGGKIVMHDVVTRTSMPEAIRTDPQLYCGCIGGAVSQDEYIKMLEKAGLTEVKAVDQSNNQDPAYSVRVSLKKALNSAVLMTAISLKDDKSFQEIVNFVRNGGLGYVLFTAKKPSARK
jgi:ubiquinone/menaquinone biosynthesis C-methylase UbiE